MAVLKSGVANLLRGKGRVGGTLTLDGRYLRFEPADPTALRESLVIHITDIKRLRSVWAKAFGTIPLAPSGLDVVMRNGEVFRFTVSGRKAWIQEIEHAFADTPRG